MVAPGTYQRLAADGTPDGSTFNVLPVESYLVHRTYIKETGLYFGEVGDAWDAVEACKRALGIKAEPEPVIETPLRAFRPAPPEECGPAGRAGDGTCMNNPPANPPGPRVFSARTWYGGYLPVTIP